MTMFVLNRNFVLRSKAGRSFEFRKNIPVYIPPMCHAEAVAIGATPADGSDPDVLGPEVAAKQVPSDPTTRRNAIMEAFDVIIGKADRNEFTAAGQPASKAVTALVGYTVPQSEIHAAWQAFCEQQAEASAIAAMQRGVSDPQPVKAA